MLPAIGAPASLMVPPTLLTCRPLPLALWQGMRSRKGTWPTIWRRCRSPARHVDAVQVSRGDAGALLQRRRPALTWRGCARRVYHEYACTPCCRPVSGHMPVHLPAPHACPRLPDFICLPASACLLPLSTWACLSAYSLPACLPARTPARLRLL